MSLRISSAERDTSVSTIAESSTDCAAPTNTGSPTEDAGEYALTRAYRTSVVSTTLAAYRRRRGRGGSGSSGGKKGLLSEPELAAVEESFSEGLTAVQVVDLFVSRGVRFSEASFRKYVQQGLLPRSRRIGRKGKHRGSMGVYPVKTVRRINQIKRLMGEGYTIEEIQDQFLRFSDAMESLEEGFAELFSRLEEEATSPRFDNRTRRALEREITDARATADELLARIDSLSRRVSQAKGEDYRSAGAAGSAEDLL